MMSPIEIMALIVVIFSAVKILVLAYNPKAWLGTVQNIYKNPCLTTIVALVLAAGSLYYLLMELNIIQIFSVFFFIMALMLLAMAQYSKDTLAFATKVLTTKNVLAKSWLTLIIWIVLLAWVLYVMFV